MLLRVLAAVLVAVVVYLLALLVLGLFALPTYPWAALVALLAGLGYFLSGHEFRRL